MRGTVSHQEVEQVMSGLSHDMAHDPRLGVRWQPPKPGNWGKAYEFMKSRAGEAAVVMGCLGLLTAACDEQKPTPAPTPIVIPDRMPTFTYTPQLIFPSPAPTTTEVRPTVTSTVAPTSTPKPTETPVRTATPKPTETLVSKALELKVEGGKFVEGGRGIILRGAAAPHFIWNLPTDKKRVGLPAFLRDIQILKSWGANFLEIPFNSAYLLNDKDYRSAFRQALEGANKLGFRIQISLHSRGENGPGDPIQLHTADENLLTDWKNITLDTELAEMIRKNVDIFGVLSEPADISADKWRKITDRVIAEVRVNLGVKIAAAISGVDLASDLKGVTDNLPENTAIEYHTYYKHFGGNPPDFTRIITDQKKQGVMVYVGEFGWKDQLAQVENSLTNYDQNGISYSLWNLRRGSDVELFSEDGTLRPAAQSLIDHLKTFQPYPDLASK
jgi:hypothetical protein